MQTLRTGLNCMEDPRLTRLYEAIHRVTSGPIWSARRHVDIWKLNTGRYDHLIDVEFYRNPGGRPAVEL